MVRILRGGAPVRLRGRLSGPAKGREAPGGLKNAFYRVINKFSDVEFVANASDFRTMRRPVAEALVAMGGVPPLSKGLFSWVGFATKFIPYQVRAREVGGDQVVVAEALPLRLGRHPQLQHGPH